MKSLFTFDLPCSCHLPSVSGHLLLSCVCGSLSAVCLLHTFEQLCGHLPVYLLVVYVALLSYSLCVGPVCLLVVCMALLGNSVCIYTNLCVPVCLLVVYMALLSNSVCMYQSVCTSLSSGCMCGNAEQLCPHVPICVYQSGFWLSVLHF